MSIFFSMECTTKLQCLYRFKWVQFFMNYLGVKITPDTASLYKTNFCLLLSKIHLHLQLWQTLTLMWFGRYNAFKMTPLPQILYLMKVIWLLNFPNLSFFHFRLCWPNLFGAIKWLDFATLCLFYLSNRVELAYLTCYHTTELYIFPGW